MTARGAGPAGQPMRHPFPTTVLLSLALSACSRLDARPGDGIAFRFLSVDPRGNLVDDSVPALRPWKDRLNSVTFFPMPVMRLPYGWGGPEEKAALRQFLRENVDVSPVPGDGP